MKQYITDSSLQILATQNSDNIHCTPLSSDLMSLCKCSKLNTSKCYGCALNVVEHCLTMLRALSANINARKELCLQGLICELVEYNIHQGSNQVCILCGDMALDYVNKELFFSRCVKK